MRTFMDKDFLLENEMAKTLFRKYAEHQSIYDYHNHLPPREIAERRKIRKSDAALAGGGSLQMACDARLRCGRAVHHRQRVGI